MVAKPSQPRMPSLGCLNLAKIHMVAKHINIVFLGVVCLNLAKIHMVAKHIGYMIKVSKGLNLAKIHMVAKHGQEDIIKV